MKEIAIGTQEQLSKKFTAKIKRVMKLAGCVKGRKVKTSNRDSVLSIQYDNGVRLHVSNQVMTFIVQNNECKTLMASFLLTMPNKKHLPIEQYKKIIADLEKMTERKFGTPWYGENDNLYSLSEMRLGRIGEPVPCEPRIQQSAVKYDPKQEYLNRRTPAIVSRQNRIASHQFANSIGGCSSNYK